MSAQTARIEQSADIRSGSRLRHLDGLRGIAALVVLIHHSLLTIPSLASAYERPGVELHDVPRMLAYTPIHLIWAGGEAVLVFFVLSGYVLTRGRSFEGTDWMAYYKSRLARLYVPVFAAVGFALVVARSINRSDGLTSTNFWIRGQSGSISAQASIHDLLLFFQPGASDGALWSLRFEIIFSVMLPFLLALLAFPQLQRLDVAVAVAVVAMYLGLWLPAPALHYLAVCALGAALALHQPVLSKLTSRVLICVGLLLLCSRWLLYGHFGEAVPVKVVQFGDIPIALGAISVLAGLTCAPRENRFLKRQVPQWLGSRSYSLYLTHVPIVVSLGVLLADKRSSNRQFGVLLACTMSLCLVVAEVFYRIVERPVVTWARRLAHQRTVGLSTSIRE